MRETISAWIGSRKGKIIEDIGRLIAFKSTEDRPAEIRGALEFVLQRGREMGFETMKTSCGDVGIVVMNAEACEETVGILAHVDVVGTGDLDKWTDDPYEMTVHDGHIWGRGTVDDKGPVIMCLYAMKAIAELDLPLKRNIWLIVGTSEETEWIDMEHFKEEFPVPDFGFSPDGEFPIFNVEKGYSDVRLYFPIEEGDPLRQLSSGDSPNTIPSKAEICFEGEDIRGFNGKSAHSSLPELGINAIELLCDKLVEEGREYGFAHFVNDLWKENVHPGSLLEIDDGTEEYSGQYVGPTTASPTILKLEDNQVIININIRTKYGVCRKQIEDSFERKAPQYGYLFEVVEFTGGMMTDCSGQPFQIMAQVLKDYGCESDFRLAEGASYASCMDNMVSWGPVFQEDFPAAHMEDERMDLNTMLIATKMYADYLYRVCVEEEDRHD